MTQLWRHFLKWSENRGKHVCILFKLIFDYLTNNIYENINFIVNNIEDMHLAKYFEHIFTIKWYSSLLSF